MVSISLLDKFDTRSVQKMKKIKRIMSKGKRNEKTGCLMYKPEKLFTLPSLRTKEKII